MYKKAELEVIRLDVEDVITTSGADSGLGTVGGDGSYPGGDSDTNEADK